jgi:hypothetical protein
MNDSRVFVDTNIFLYAALEDDFQKGKRTDAVNLLKGLNDKVVCWLIASLTFWSQASGNFDGYALFISVRMNIPKIFRPVKKTLT